MIYSYEFVNKFSGEVLGFLLDGLGVQSPAEIHAQLNCSEEVKIRSGDLVFPFHYLRPGKQIICTVEDLQEAIDNI